MWKKSVIVAFGLIGVCSLTAQAQELNMYGSDGSYSYGYVNRDGSFEMYGRDGSYKYGQINRDSSLDMYGSYRSYSRGYINSDGSGSLYGQ